MAAAQFCSTCGSPLTNGICTTCPVKMFNPTTQTSGAPATTPIAPSSPAPPAAGQQPGQWGSQGQPGAQGQWSASASRGAPASNRPGAQYVGVWNWGAFLLCPFWLMNHGRVGRGILYIVLSFIPILGLGALAMAIVYGIKGNEVAATSRYFSDDAQFVAVQNAWRNWGIGVAIVSVGLGIFAGIMEGLATATRGS